MEEDLDHIFKSGKHAGESIWDVPIGYLEFLAEKLDLADGTFKDTLLEVLEERRLEADDTDTDLDLIW